MSIKSQGGVFGRNPTFNDVTVDGDLSIAGTLSVGGETITGLSYQGGWNASTNSPDIAASSPVTGQFWIVSADGATDVGGITNWTSGDWALYDGSNWQRVEGGNTDLSTGVQGQLAVANGGTGAADAATARTNLGLGTAATTASTDYATAAQGTTADSALQPADIGSTVQGYDADTAKYDDTTANFTGTLQNGGSNVVVDSDIGSTVQAYDANTVKSDIYNSFSVSQGFSGLSSAASVTAATLINADSWDASHADDVLNIKIGSAQNGNSGGYAGIRIGDNSNAGKAVGLYARSTSNYSNGVVLDIYSGGNGGKVKRVTVGSDIDFYDPTGANAKCRWDSSEEVLAVSGGVCLGNGITVDTAHTLDDYEEGTFTPNVSGGITVGNGTLTGYYTKVGRLCHFTVRFVLGSTSSLAYPARIGTPFTTVHSYALGGGSAQFTDAGTGTYFGVCHFPPYTAGNYVKISPVGNSGTWGEINTNYPFTWTTGDVLEISCTFQTS